MVLKRRMAPRIMIPKAENAATALHQLACSDKVSEQFTSASWQKTGCYTLVLLYRVSMVLHRLKRQPEEGRELYLGPYQDPQMARRMWSLRLRMHISMSFGPRQHPAYRTSAETFEA